MRSAGVTFPCRARFISLNRREMPAAGFSLYLERVHLAQMEEERLGDGGKG